MKANEVSVLVSGRKWANLNGSHTHWRSHQALMNEWKQRTLLQLWTDNPAPVAPPVIIRATVHRTRRARADAHNVTPTIKAVIDAVVQAGVIPDDNDEIVRHLLIEPGEVMAEPSITLRVSTAPTERLPDMT